MANHPYCHFSNIQYVLIIDLFLFTDRNEMLKKAEIKFQEKLDEITSISKQKKDLEKKLQKTEKTVQESMIKVSFIHNP